MKKNYFITGTDTDCGKTLIAQSLLLKANQKGLRTVGLKPVAAGAEPAEEGLQNTDALALQQMASEKLSYSQINPVVFSAAVAPHLAAKQEGRRVTVSSLAGFVRGAMMHPADFRIIEGAGGWMVPVNDHEALSALPKLLDLDVILVVGMKLGCLNHALLTARAIRQDGLTLAGWVATQTDPNMQLMEENVASLRNMLGAPCLGVIPYQQHISPTDVVDLIELPE